jgi:hypothetical protein
LAAILLTAALVGAPIDGGDRAAAPILVQSAEPTLPNDQIRAKLVGNTISGVEDEETYSEYLKQDGKIAGFAPSGKYTGRWRIADDQICFFYDGAGKTVTSAKDWECSFVAIDGSKITWDPGPDASESTLIAGNPKGLQ